MHVPCNNKLTIICIQRGSIIVYPCDMHFVHHDYHLFPFLDFPLHKFDMLIGNWQFYWVLCEGGIVNNTLRPPIPGPCDSEWRKLMEECWSHDPAARPSFTEITNRLRNMSVALQSKRYNRVKRWDSTHLCKSIEQIS